MAQKSALFCFSSQSCVLQFFSIFFRLCRQQAWEILLTQDDLLCSSRQKIIEAYFATKSVLLTQRQCRRDFGRDNLPGRRTIQRLVVKFWETRSVADAPQSPQWSTSFKSNKSGSFSILWLISSQNGFLFWIVLFSLPLQDLNFVERAEGRHGRSSKMMFSKCQLFFWKTFLGKSSWHSRKFWIFLGIMPNDERSWPLWASATLPVYWNVATKRWIVLPLGTLFLSKFFFLHCRCVRRTDLRQSTPRWFSSAAG